ncbi:BlaI/MecI/CopY family transcriptional regulator [Kangiella aquimarina]|uniref:BlaI/MecI/CopY family transcriptional regulator n=1 Tax=Kangiella aquimarina TaxID=261965 RepID=A0ABZ0X349_9GAMM|nr:BlaI/MecI/CopY family transcriptional regulator [Kangiella aquimarina]WQG84934.1 BlaI/MecI/CopY family transcriptional regulator [Kangiella aquimarina]
MSQSMSIRVSEAEKNVMDILWQESPLTSTEVVERLQTQDWSEKTVKTFLNRLVKKGVVTFQKDGRRYLYSPAIERDEFLADESESFLDKVFKGNIKELLATFVDNKQLSKDELDYLKGLLADKESKDVK